MFICVVTISGISEKQAKKSPIPCPSFGESQVLGSSQIPDPVKIFIGFPIPAPYFGPIPGPENNLPDPEECILSLSLNGVLKGRFLEYICPKTGQDFTPLAARRHP